MKFFVEVHSCLPRHILPRIGISTAIFPLNFKFLNTTFGVSSFVCRVELSGKAAFFVNNVIFSEEIPFCLTAQLLRVREQNQGSTLVSVVREDVSDRALEKYWAYFLLCFSRRQKMCIYAKFCILKLGINIRLGDDIMASCRQRSASSLPAAYPL